MYNLPEIIERFWIYSVPVGNVNSGNTARIRFTTDNDAPFLLRGLQAHQDQGAALTAAQLQFTDERRSVFQSAPVGITPALANLYGTIPIGGLNAQASPIRPQVVYPAGASIDFTLLNNSGANYTNAILLLRGVKLFRRGSIWSPTYREGCKHTLPFEQSISVQNLGATETRRNILWRWDETSSDFVLRAGHVAVDTAFGAGTYKNLFLQLYDPEGRPYSNAAVHTDYLFAHNLASRPGVIYPEIYLPSGQQLFFDVQRSDGAAAAINVFVVFDGVKVFR